MQPMCFPSFKSLRDRFPSAPLMSNLKLTTMLYFNFKNYEEFKEIFGTRVANNGKKVRSNHILLSFLKHEFKCKRFKSLRIMSVSIMESTILDEVFFK